MALKIPAELKKITQYIRRAEELSKSPQQTPETLIVAYHCRQFAVKSGIPLATTADGKKCLGDILTILEENRSKMGNFSNDEKYKICRDWALKIFDKADGEDRAGMSDKGTAKTFYAAASFLDILKQFHSDDLESEDAVEEQKKSFYAKWKSTEILKAIKEGREVKAGGYGEDIPDDDSAPEVPKVDEGTEVAVDGSMRNIVPPPPPYPGDSAAFLPPPVAPQKILPIPAPESEEEEEEPPPPTFMSSIFGASNPKKYTKATLADAKELTIFAMKALDEKDGALAAERLKQALECLGH